MAKRPTLWPSPRPRAMCPAAAETQHSRQRRAASSLRLRFADRRCQPSSRFVLLVRGRGFGSPSPALLSRSTSLRIAQPAHAVSRRRGFLGRRYRGLEVTSVCIRARGSTSQRRPPPPSRLWLRRFCQPRLPSAAPRAPSTSRPSPPAHQASLWALAQTDRFSFAALPTSLTTISSADAQHAIHIPRQ